MRRKEGRVGREVRSSANVDEVLLVLSVDIESAVTDHPSNLSADLKKDVGIYTRAFGSFLPLIEPCVVHGASAVDGRGGRPLEMESRRRRCTFPPHAFSHFEL